jgi:hypothetical protein
VRSRATHRSAIRGRTTAVAGNGSSSTTARSTDRSTHSFSISGATCRPSSSRALHCRSTARSTVRIWALRNARWQLIDSLGPRRVGFGRAARDATRERLVVPVLYGGDDAGVWEWDGRTWSRQAASAMSTHPSTRQTYALEFDPVRRATVLAGGQGSSRGPYLTDVWSWDGRSWTALAPSGDAPAGRGGGHLLSDPANRRLLYFGGYAGQVLAELWALGDSAWMRLSP